MGKTVYSIIAAAFNAIFLLDNRLSILIYHRILPDSDSLRPGDPTAASFDWQMKLISRVFNPLSLDDALKGLESGKLPKRAVCVTFDDGYSDNEAIALPILKKWNVPATVFVSTGYLNGGIMWNDVVIEVVRRIKKNEIDLREVDLGVYSVGTDNEKLESIGQIISAIKYMPLLERQRVITYMSSLVHKLPSNLMMTNEQVKKISSEGIEVGGHTCRHPILSSVSLADAEKEISDGKCYLENLIEKPLRFFAYPNGKKNIDYIDAHRDLVERLGFSAALTTERGVSNQATDRFQIPRFTPWDKTCFRFFLRMLVNQKTIV